MSVGQYSHEPHGNTVMSVEQTTAPLFCIAHRGGLGYAPENTLPAFTNALSIGADAIEIDVWKLGEELLVTHDRRLGRHIPGIGLLLNYSARELRKIPLGEGIRVPILREVLQLLNGRIELNIELKGGDCATAVAAELESFVRDTNGSFDSYLVSSFDHHQLYRFKQLLPAVRRGVLVAHNPLDHAQCCEALDAYSLHPNLSSLQQTMIDDAHRRGLKVFVYTVNEEDDWKMMVEMRVDGVFTDYPERLLAMNTGTKIEFSPPISPIR